MQISTAQMMTELRKTASELTTQIEAVKTDMQKQIEVLPYPDMVTVYDMKDRNGRHVLTDLLCARAEVQAAMVRLMTAK